MRGFTATLLIGAMVTAAAPAFARGVHGGYGGFASHGGYAGQGGYGRFAGHAGAGNYGRFAGYRGYHNFGSQYGQPWLGFNMPQGAPDMRMGYNGPQRGNWGQSPANGQGGYQGDDNGPNGQ